MGGGAKSRTYLGIFADTFNTRIRKTNIDQDAGSLGAAAVAAVGCGLWDAFDQIDQVHKTLEFIEPRELNVSKYEQLLPIFERAIEFQAALSDALHEVDLS